MFFLGGCLGANEDSKTFLIALEVNSGPETVHIKTIYNTFLLKKVYFQ